MAQKTPLTGHWLIVSDLDGTLLDHYDYSHAPVDALLATLERKGIPLILNSSKTRPEMCELRRALGNHHPFIVENGSAIFIPAGYFPQKPAAAREEGDYWIIEPGTPRAQLLDYLHTDALHHGAPYLSFAAASREEIVAATGLSPEQAASAGERDYSEPLLWRGSEEEKRKFRDRAKLAGFTTLEGGRFLHLLGQTDKGTATLTLLDCYHQQRRTEYRLIAAGDSPNDLDMLEVAQIAVIVRAPHREPPHLVESAERSVIISQRCGPAGWRECIEPLFFSA